MVISSSWVYPVRAVACLVNEEEPAVPVDIDGIVTVLNNQAVLLLALPDLHLATF